MIDALPISWKSCVCVRVQRVDEEIAAQAQLGLAPPGIGAVQTLHSRQHLTVGLDGTVEMWAEDAQYFIPDGWTKLAEWTTDEDADAERSKPQTNAPARLDGVVRSAEKKG